MDEHVLFSSKHLLKTSFFLSGVTSLSLPPWPHAFQPIKGGMADPRDGSLGPAVGGRVTFRVVVGGCVQSETQSFVVLHTLIY